MFLKLAKYTEAKIVARIDNADPFGNQIFAFSLYSMVHFETYNAIKMLQWVQYLDSQQNAKCKPNVFIFA